MTTANREDLPVVVIGAGPVGLAAAAHLADRELPFLVLEAGDEVGAAVSEWGHIRTFTPWRYIVGLSSWTTRAEGGDFYLATSGDLTWPPAGTLPRPWTCGAAGMTLLALRMHQSESAAVGTSVWRESHFWETWRPSWEQGVNPGGTAVQGRVLSRLQG